jgi:hypothetical protein
MATPRSAQLADIGRLIEGGHVRAEVEKVFWLAKAAEAERILENGHVSEMVLEIAA